MTLIQLSDLHLRAGDDGRGPAERLRRVVHQVAALQPQPAAVLLSGDLADDPSGAAYEQVHELLAPLGAPIHAIPGNHDGRARCAREASTRPPAGAGRHLRACAHRDDHILRGATIADLPQHQLGHLPGHAPAGEGSLLGEPAAWVRRTHTCGWASPLACAACGAVHLKTSWSTMSRFGHDGSILKLSPACTRGQLRGERGWAANRHTTRPLRSRPLG
jgi:hypothetical protein